MLRVLYGTSIGGLVLRQSSFQLGVKGIWSPCLMACGRGHNDLSATSMELGYKDRYRELAKTTFGPN